MTHRPKKILITNAVPVNNGDTALLYALYEALVNRGHQVTIATHYYQITKETYPDLPLIKELGDYFILRKLPFLKPLFMRLAFFFRKSYHAHDVFISCPGGYVNSYYNLKNSLTPLVLAKRQGKKTAIYSQSVGPLNPEDQALLNEMSRSIDLILLRDDFSIDYLKHLNLSSKTFQTKDAAFMLPLGTAKGQAKKLAVSVREWKFDNRSMNHYHTLIQKLVFRAISEGYQVEFISTCQGIPNYKDDSKTALDIMNQLIEKHPELVPKMKVNENKYSLPELIHYLQHNFNCVLGTRLHMCILSLMNDLPAFNISYEIKGKECYNYLGLEAYSSDFNEPIEEALAKFDQFLLNLGALKPLIRNRVLEIQKESFEHFERACKELGI